MSYPTTLNFQIISPYVGAQPINVTSTTQLHPIGTRVKARDATYGEAEFIYMQGVANTAAGDFCTLNSKSGATVRTVAASRGPVGVAMSANVANQYGWYAVQGAVPASTAAAGTGAANSLLEVTATAGQATVSGDAGVKIDGVLCTSAQDGPGAGFTDVQLDFPAANTAT